MRSLLVTLIAIVLWLQVCLVAAAPTGGKNTGPKRPAANSSSKSAPGSSGKAKAGQNARLTKGKNAPPNAVKIKSVKPEAAPKEANPKHSEPKTPDDAYTSVVIDTSGLKLDKAMGPKVLRGDGSEVWGTLKNLKDEDYAFLDEHGMVAYAATIEEAKASPRCGLRPLIVKAVETQGGRPQCNPVVADADADLILSENGKGKFLEKFNVIFIRNESPAAVPEPAPEGAEKTGSPAN